VILLACAAVFPAQVFAQSTNTFIGGANGDWNIAANWSAGIVPSNGAQTWNVQVDGGTFGSSNVNVNSFPTINRLDISSGDSVTLGSASSGQSLTIVRNAQSGSGVVVNNGSVTINGPTAGNLTLQFTGPGTPHGEITGSGVINLNGSNASISTNTTTFLHGAMGYCP
jgi:hypothetical protein